MIIKLTLVYIDSNYCDYLRQFDSKVAYNMNEKEIRPFIGILFKIKDCEYFAPLSSPKPKHLKMRNTLDFFKLDGGKLGAVNFNNMIPVKNNNYTLIPMDDEIFKLSDSKYYSLLDEQLTWLNENINQVKNKSHRLYELYNNGKLSDNIKKRCCNFKLLEEKCEEYNK